MKKLITLILVIFIALTATDLPAAKILWEKKYGVAKLTGFWWEKIYKKDSQYYICYQGNHYDTMLGEYQRLDGFGLMITDLKGNIIDRAEKYDTISLQINIPPFTNNFRFFESMGFTNNSWVRY
jgi:hypothetical protein